MDWERQEIKRQKKKKDTRKRKEGRMKGVKWPLKDRNRLASNRYYSRFPFSSKWNIAAIYNNILQKWSFNCELGNCEMITGVIDPAGAQEKKEEKEGSWRKRERVRARGACVTKERRKWESKRERERERRNRLKWMH